MSALHIEMGTFSDNLQAFNLMFLCDTELHLSMETFPLKDNHA